MDFEGYQKHTPAGYGAEFEAVSKSVLEMKNYDSDKVNAEAEKWAKKAAHGNGEHKNANKLMQTSGPNAMAQVQNKLKSLERIAQEANQQAEVDLDAARQSSKKAA